MVRNGIFWTIGEQYYIVYFRIISYRRINIYRVETIDIGRSHCNNDVSGTIIVQNGMFWTIGEQYYIVYYPIISYRKIKV